MDNNPASPYYGYLYVVWTNFSDGRIWATTSTDGGTTWGAIQGISSSSNVQGAWPAVAPDGTVYAGWVEFGCDHLDSEFPSPPTGARPGAR